MVVSKMFSAMVGGAGLSNLAVGMVLRDRSAIHPTPHLNLAGQEDFADDGRQLLSLI